MEDLENNNKKYRKSAVDVMKGQNLGDLPDWFSDARFAQQSFTGANPCTIRLASHEWTARFKEAARVQKVSTALDFIDQATKNLCSCRTVVISIRRSRLVQRRSSKQKIATTTLFHLTPNGRLHPLAILIDRRCSIADSVTILNKRLTPLDPESSDFEYHLNQEKQD